MIDSTDIDLDSTIETTFGGANTTFRHPLPYCAADSTDWAADIDLDSTDWAADIDSTDCAADSTDWAADIDSTDWAADIDPSVLPFDNFWTSIFTFHNMMTKPPSMTSPYQLTTHTIDPDNAKARHAAVERDRRKKLNQKYDTLMRHIPSLMDNPHPTRNDILKAATCLLNGSVVPVRSRVPPKKTNNCTRTIKLSVPKVIITKVVHNMEERKRRLTLSNKFKKLRLNIPHLNDETNVTQSQILMGAIILTFKFNSPLIDTFEFLNEKKNKEPKRVQTHFNN